MHVYTGPHKPVNWLSKMKDTKNVGKEAYLCTCLYTAAIVLLKIWHKGPDSVYKKVLLPVIFLNHQSDHQ